MRQVKEMPRLPESVDEIAASLGIDLDLETSERFKAQMSRPFKRPSQLTDPQAIFARYNSLTGKEASAFYTEHRDVLVTFIKTPSR